MSNPSPSRRRFLRSTLAAGTAPFLLPSRGGALPANEKLQHAAIGTSNQGWSNLKALASHPDIEVVALCDIDLTKLTEARAMFPKARWYQDYRHLLATEGDQVDSVNVATPDHMHAAITLAAIGQGKHVYCQKPLTQNVAEAREVRLAAAKAGVATQMGNQIQSTSGYRTAVRWIQEGLIGRVTEIHAWCGGNRSQTARPDRTDPVPESLDWDRWIGVAPTRPYVKGVYHPFEWRCWRDFGGGILGDMACHILDTPFKSTGIRTPRSVRATVDPAWANDERAFTESFPKWEKVEWMMEGTELTEKEVPFTWYDGDNRHPEISLFDFENKERKPPRAGALFIGSEGRLLLPHVHEPELLPRSSMKGRDLPREKQGNHYHSYVNACLGREKTGSNFDYAGPLTETVHLGRAAQKHHGQWLEWDAATLEITNLPDANQWLSREYRKGW